MNIVPNKLDVSINFGECDIPLGQIISEGKSYYFKYMTSYLEKGNNISPFHLKFDNSIQKVNTDIFEGIFGVFSDSQPDGWGRLLMDRFLMNLGWHQHEISPLLRLSLVGKNGIGALVYKPVFLKQNEKINWPNLDTIYRQSMAIYNEESNDIDEIYLLGGSAGGARPKIWIYYNEFSDSFSQIKKENYEPWIIKFPSSFDIEGIATVEYVYYQLALLAGINMNTSKLFLTNSENHFFGTKRFDIESNKRYHMISAAGLLHDNYHLSNIDYGHLMDAAFRLTKSIKSYTDVLTLAVFNVLSNNKDDHSKNFSFLMDSNGEWKLAPAYDLTYSNSSHGYQSTSVDGESKAIKYNHFQQLAKDFGVHSLDEIVDEVISILNSFTRYANKTNIPNKTKTQISNTIKENIKQFKA